MVVPREPRRHVSDVFQGPALEGVRDPDGRDWQVEVVSPGEPVDHRAGHALMTIVLGGIHSPGLYDGGGLLDAHNLDFVVLVFRQRGPFRGMDRVQEARFVHAREAQRHRDAVVAAIRAGSPLPTPPR